MCKCHSYNWHEQGVGVPNVIALDPHAKKNVCLDACIADAIKKLWAAGVHTVGSCCGHNRCKPSVILAEGSTNEQQALAKYVLDGVDDREWDVLMWKLVPVDTDDYQAILTQRGFTR